MTSTGDTDKNIRSDATDGNPDGRDSDTSVLDSGRDPVRDPSVREEYSRSEGDQADRQPYAGYPRPTAAGDQAGPAPIHTGAVPVGADADTPAAAHPGFGHDTGSSPVTPIATGRRRSETVPDAVAGQTGPTPESDWRDLQARFVDDPQATVDEAATLIERDLAGLRAKLAGGSTEDLRTAFRRYRTLHESLS